MDIIVASVRRGFVKGIKTTIMLMKVVIPVYSVVVVIKHSPIMGYLGKIFGPVMKLFGLPADAAIPLITGWFTDEYGMIAVTTQFDFTPWQITTIAMMGMVCHALPVEYAMSKKIGLPANFFLFYRIIAAIIIGLILSAIGGLF